MRVGQPIPVPGVDAPPVAVLDRQDASSLCSLPAALRLMNSGGR